MFTPQLTTVRFMLITMVLALAQSLAAGQVSNAKITDRPLVRHVGLVAPDLLFLEIHALNTDKPGIVPFTLKEDDEVKLSGYEVDDHLAEAAGVAQFMEEGKPVRLFRQVMRDGRFIGYLVGYEGDWHLTPIHPFIGERLDVAVAGKPGSWTLSSPADAAYRTGQSPTAVYRKSEPRTGANQGNWGMEWTERHLVYLKLPEPLEPGKKYALQPPAEQFPQPVTFTFDPAEVRSEAIQVNQVGYRPTQNKFALLSTWIPKFGGVDFADVDSFEVVNAEGEVVFTGAPQRVEDNLHADDLTNAPVWKLDFSPVREEGTYRVVVPGVGASYAFPIAQDVWEKPLRAVMKGFLHQRSGIEIKPPVLQTAHPLDHHPDMPRFVVHKADRDTFKRAGGSKYIFSAIQHSIDLDTEDPDAWGGWRDAGDSDRQTDHMHVVGDLVTAWASNPTYFENLDLGMPAGESGNHIPDILDEAIWGTEIWMRTQFDDGGVPAFIEAIEHPRAGEPPAYDSLPWATSGPEIRDTATYAGNAAFLALALEKYDDELSKKVADSAARAFAFSESNHPSKNRDVDKQRRQRALAAAALYRLTGEDKWQSKFKENLDTDRYWIGHLVYAQADVPGVDENLQARLRQGILDEADEVLARQKLSPYRSVRDTWPEGKTWGLTWPERIRVLAAAYILQPSARYARAMEDAYAFTLGTNPKNLVYMSGLGSRKLYPYDIQVWLNLIDTPVGLPVQGYSDHWRDPENKHKDRLKRDDKRAGRALWPRPQHWPDAEAFWYGGYGYEHTVQHMGPTAMAWGVLAQHDDAKPAE
jgi:endoglucanase